MIKLISKESLGRQVAWVTVDYATSTSATFAISILLARELGPAGLGDWRLLTATLTICSYIMGTGLSLTLGRYVAEYFKENRPAAVGQLLTIALSIRCIVLLLFLTAYLSYTHLAFGSGNTQLLQPNTSLIVAMAILLFMVNDLLGRSFLIGIFRRDLVALVQITSKLALLLAIFILEIVSLLNFLSATVSLAISYMLEFGLYVYVLIKLEHSLVCKTTVNGGMSSFELKTIRRFALNQYIFQILQVAREYAVDSYMLQWLRGVEAVGIYGAGVSIPSIVRVFSPTKMFGGIILPRLVRSGKHKNDTEHIYFYFNFIQKLNALLMFPIITVCIVLAPLIISTLFGPAFLESVNVFRFLMLLLIVGTAADTFYPICLALEHSNIMSKTAGWGLVNVFLNLVLIPEFGPIGAAVSTGSISIFIYIHFRVSLEKCGLLLLYPWRSVLVIAGSMLPMLVVLVIAVNSETSVTYIAVLVGIGLFIYLMLLRRFSPFSLDEKVFLSKTFKRASGLVIKGV